MYTRLKLRVPWNGKRSKVFSICNGVKQGGILSPILFCVYTDAVWVMLMIYIYIL